MSTADAADSSLPPPPSGRPPKTISSMPPMRAILVTGANKGIGFELCKEIMKFAPDAFVFLGSRDHTRGRDAVDSIVLKTLGPSEKREKLGLEDTELVSRVKLIAPLDVTDEDSVNASYDKISKFLKKQCKDAERADQMALWAIVNNAGGGSDNLEDIVDLNVRGVEWITRKFAPLLKPFQSKNPRIVNLNSGAGPKFMSDTSAEVQKFLLALPDENGRQRKLTYDILEEKFMGVAKWIYTDPKLSDDEKMAALIEAGIRTESVAGSWTAPHPMGAKTAFCYGLTKAAMNCLTLIHAREGCGSGSCTPECAHGLSLGQAPGVNVLVNSCSPGFIETDLARPLAERMGKTPAEMGMLPVVEGTRCPMFLLFDEKFDCDFKAFSVARDFGSEVEFLPTGRFYGSDMKRSPMHRPRDPDKDPEFDGNPEALL